MPDFSCCQFCGQPFGHCDCVPRPPSNLAFDRFARATAKARVTAEHLGNLMIAGQLTEKIFWPYSEQASFNTFNPDAILSTVILRPIFVETYSWFVFTREWLTHLRTVVAGKRVVEVCAGRGYLQPLLKDCCDWICTDLRPRNPWVLKQRAGPAARTLKPDLLFASWIPLNSLLDACLARIGVPLILIGEEKGCTGSDYFWEHCSDHVRPASDWPAIPTWPGVHDDTWLVNWP